MLEGGTNLRHERLQEEADAIRMGLITPEELAAMDVEGQSEDERKMQAIVDADDRVSGRMSSTDEEDEQDEVGVFGVVWWCDGVVWWCGGVVVW